MAKWKWNNFRCVKRIGYVYVTELLQDKTTKEYLWYKRSPVGIMHDIISQRFSKMKDAIEAKENNELDYQRMHNMETF